MPTKKQHFVPQFYLKNFANANDDLWIYRRSSKGDGAAIRKSSVRKVCVENNLYEVPLQNSPEQKYIEREAIETALSRAESKFALSLTHLIEYDSDKPSISPESLWKHLSIVIIFAANLIVRNPKWIKTRRKLAEPLTHCLLSQNFFSSSDLSELEKLGYSSDLQSIVELSIQHVELLSPDSQSSTMKIAETFNEMSVALLRAPADTSFITSSFPVTVSWTDEETKNPDWAYFPLSATSALIFHKEHQRDFFYWRVPAEKVEELNTYSLETNAFWDIAIANNKAALETCLLSVP